MNYENGGQLYSKFPDKIQGKSLNKMFSVCMGNSKATIKIYEQNLFLNFGNENIILNIDNLQPISFHYQHKSSDQFLSEYYLIELNSVKSIEI